MKNKAICGLRNTLYRRGMSEEAYYTMLCQSAQTNGQLLCLSQLLARSARLFPNNIALIWQDREISYKELFYRSCIFSKKVKRYGVHPRDRVLLHFENSLEFYVGYYGILQVGAVIVPLNTFLKKRELEHIMSDARPRLIVACTRSSALFSSTGLPVLTEVDMDLDSSVPEQVSEVQIPVLDPDEMIALLYTSGTTGLPKGVMLSSRNIIMNMIQGISRLKMDQCERLFGVLPMFHSFAQNTCVWSSIFMGCTVILVPKIDRRAILHALGHKPTIFLGVPALYGLLCLFKNAPLESVNYFISGGDALPDKIRMAFALIYGRKICSGYGLTEASPFVSVDFFDETVPTNTVGRPLMNVHCSMRDENGVEVAVGEIGELWIRGDNIMLGYYNEPTMTAEVIIDGWLHTGDLAYFDMKGSIVITGRIKDLIIHKGLNIYPQEIENVIMGHPNVIRVGVVGKSIEDGQIPIAFVQLKKYTPGFEKVLKSLCVNQLASYKVPRDFFLTTKDLLTTATGKVDKKVLRKQLADA